MWRTNDIGLLPNEERSDEERLLHVEGNMMSNGINVHHADSIQVDNSNVNQSEQIQRQSNLCGVGWDVKHTILVILVISTIVIMITTFSVVLAKCSQVRILIINYSFFFFVVVNSTFNILLTECFMFWEAECQRVYYFFYLTTRVMINTGTIEDNYIEQQHVKTTYIVC